MTSEIIESFSFFVKGFSVGFMASIPLGPIGVMCIQRTLSKGHRSGVVSGLGAASADLIFAIIAVFSLTLVMSFVETHMSLLKLLGGICVIVMGVYIFLKNPAVQIRKNRAGKGSLWSDFITIFFLTLTNPAFILVFVSLFAAMGVGQYTSGGHIISSMFLLLVVYLGGNTWWLTLTSLVSLLRNKFRPRHLLWINRISGALIATLGIIAIVSIFFNTPIDKIDIP
jgi:threonine/homoserine/homoserine lactone efflux protein